MSEYIKNRLQPEINWYEKKSARNKNLYYGFRAATIFLSGFLALMGYFNNLPGWAIGLTATVIIMVEAFDAFLKPQENWINFRTTAETLKHEKEMFNAKAGAYATSPTEQMLAERCEMLISREHSIWQAQAKQKKEG